MLTYYSSASCRLVQFLYNLLLAVLAPAAIPVWVLRSLAKGHSFSSLLEALGRIPTLKNTTRGASVWFHAVSVGEVQSSLPLLRGLRRSMPEVPIYVSTGTVTGRALAQNSLEGVATAVIRAPVDLPWCVARVFSTLRPRVMIVSETELWPNYFFQAKRFGTSAMIVNGRISDRSAPRYRRLRFLFRAALDCIDSILVQSDADRERFIAAGAPSARTFVGGNLKYDFDSRSSTDEVPPVLMNLLRESAPDLVLVAGSTRETEEELLEPGLLDVANCVRKSLLVVAPRHPHRFDEAAAALQGTGLPVHRRSRLGRGESIDLPAIVLLDSLGELASLYCRADLVFVGGSLNGWGGHNVLEPVLFGKPVVVGPHMQNFRQIASGLRQAGGLVQVGDSETLRRALVDLARDAGKRRAIGAAGQAFAESQRGATERAKEEALRLYRIALPWRPPRFVEFVALGIPAAAWEIGARVRRHAYATGMASSRQLATPVLSVGNITVGGTGKTPTAAWLVERLWERGLVAGILTRGYGRRSSQLEVLGTSDSADPRRVGDEPAMLARRFISTAPMTRFAVHPDRFSAGHALEECGDIDFFVLDDGFQHMQLRRVLNIVLLDASEPFGNGHALPLGRLREGPASLSAADLVLLTRCDPDMDYRAIQESVSRVSPRAPVFNSRMLATDLIDIKTGKTQELESLLEKRVAAFCGIGNPHSFFLALPRFGCESVLQRSYRDHHRYTSRDKAILRNAAVQSGADAFVTTAKDAVNLGDPDELALPAYAVQIELQVDNAEEFLTYVLAAVGGQVAAGS